MEKNYIEELEKYCAEKNIIEPKYKTINSHGMYASKVTIKEEVSGDGVAASEREAMNFAARDLLSKVTGNTFKQITEGFNKISLNVNLDNSNSKNFSNVSEDSTDGEPSNEVTGNPIGDLQELCAQKGYQLPEYEELDRKGSDHDPIFSYQCKVCINGREYVGEGKAKSKQLSKKTSAEHALRQIKEDSTRNESQKVNNVQQVPDSIPEQSNQITCENFSHIISQNSVQIPAIDESMGNPIGYLQELCTKNGYSLPKYEDPIRYGVDHRPEFITKCRININGREFVGEGKGFNKQISKKASAQDVITKMRENTNNSSRNESKTHDSRPDREEQFIDYLSDNFSGNSELNVQIKSNDCNYCEKLARIAAFIGCNVNYIEVNNDKVMLRLVITHLSNDTLITSYGSSHNGLEAKEIAAEKAILMLKTLNAIKTEMRANIK